MSEILTAYNTATLGRAIAANHLQFYHIYARQPEVNLQQQGDELAWFSSPLPVTYLNQVMRTNLAASEIERAIEQMLAHYRPLGVQFVWRTWPDTLPTDLGPRLLARNFSERGSVPNMAADLSHLPTDWPAPPQLQVQRINEAAQMGHWAAVVQSVYEATPQFGAFLQRTFSSDLADGSRSYYYLGWMGDKAVAAATLFPAAGVAGIYRVATLADYRGQGIGGAVVLAAMRDAAAMGYRYATLRSSEMGYHLYQRLGYRDEFRTMSYNSPALG